MAYFDWNATAPLLPSAREAWLEIADTGWANPSAVYRAGARSKVQLEEARSRIASVFEVSSPQIVFTSGASESNNAFLRIAADRYSSGSIWISSIEHPSVREPALHYWGSQRVIQIPVTEDGLVDLNWMETRLKQQKPAMISVMAVNNETGVMQPVESIDRLCEKYGIPFFSDAVQWIGKIPQPFSLRSPSNAYSVSAHKFGAPKGIGCLVFSEDWGRTVLQHGGGQESGARAGTEDLAGITAMAVALEARMESVTEDQKQARDRFETQLEKAFPTVIIHGKNVPRVWNTVSVSLPDFRSQRWIVRLDKKGFQLSTGAACSAGKKGPSMVMQAMGIEDEAARRTVRISGGWDTNPRDWCDLFAALIEVYDDLRHGETDSGPGRVIQI